MRRMGRSEGGAYGRTGSFGDLMGIAGSRSEEGVDEHVCARKGYGGYLGSTKR